MSWKRPPCITPKCFSLNVGLGPVHAIWPTCAASIFDETAAESPGDRPERREPHRFPLYESELVPGQLPARVRITAKGGGHAGKDPATSVGMAVTQLAYPEAPQFPKPYLDIGGGRPHSVRIRRCSPSAFSDSRVAQLLTDKWHKPGFVSFHHLRRCGVMDDEGFPRISHVLSRGYVGGEGRLCSFSPFLWSQGCKASWARAGCAPGIVGHLRVARPILEQSVCIERACVTGQACGVGGRIVSLGKEGRAS